MLESSKGVSKLRASSSTLMACFSLYWLTTFYFCDSGCPNEIIAVLTSGLMCRFFFLRSSLGSRDCCFDAVMVDACFDCFEDCFFDCYLTRSFCCALLKLKKLPFTWDMD